MIEDVVRMAKSHGIDHFKYGELEFRFQPNRNPTPTEQLTPPPTNMAIGMPADDEMLFYSTPTFDHIQTEREDK